MNAADPPAANPAPAAPAAAAALPPTEPLFRDDADCAECRAVVLAWDDAGVVLNRTVCYPQGGGQAGDAGELVADGSGGLRLPIADTRKHPLHPGAIAHVPAAAADGAEDAARRAAFTPGAAVTVRIDVARRRAHRRLHTATHLLCALLPYPVDGCSITAGYARLDFHTAEPIDKDALNAGLARLIAQAHPVQARWIDEAALDADPALVRSLRVQPPRGQGRVRVLDIDGVDVQPCGGTHVASSADVGDVVVTKIEKKSALTRRVVLGFATPPR